MGWFLLLSLVPLLTSSAVGYLRSQHITEGLLEESLNVTSLLQVLHVQNRAERHINFLRAVATGNAFLRAAARRAHGIRGEVEAIATQAAVEAYLARQAAEGSGAFDDLYLLDLEGHLLASTSIKAVDPTAFACSGHSVGVSVVHGVAASRPPTVCISVPVTDIEGAPVAILGGVVSPDGLVSFLLFPSPAGVPTRTIILDETDRPVYFSERTESESYAAVYVTQLRESGDQDRYVSGRGVDVVGRRTQIPGVPWTQITEVPVEAALGPLRDLGKTTVFFEASFALLVVGVAWFVSGGIVAPIDRLVTATRQLGSGDLNARVEQTADDEIGELARAFNDMAEELARTSRRVAELHQKEIERAQHLASVGELASGLVHEIKNPVVGISHGIDLVRRRIGPNPSVDPILGEVTRELRRIEVAIRDLLTFARPASPTLTPTRVDFVIERACRLAQPSADHRGVSLLTRPRPDIPPVPADAALLQQALVNVVLNAIEATQPGGEVQVALGTADNSVVIRISDTGVGIPLDQRDLVFKPFYTTRLEGGTGLGLSITKDIVERQGGRVRIVDSEAPGAIIEIALPVEGPPEREPDIQRGDGGP